jgi:hypothetical protein
MPSIRALLQHRATILRPAQGTPTATGARPITWTTMASSVPCRIAGGTLARFADRDGRLAADTSRVGYFQAGTDLLPRDRIQVATVRGCPAGLFTVTAIDPQGDDIYLKVLLTIEQPTPLPETAG